jgi:diadenosine tetraphosphate (Ap4A) HIT family hydrolase
MKDFLEISPERILHDTERFFVVKDSHPVSPGHCLIISKALRKTYFELSREEQQELALLINVVKDMIEKEFSPDGYNIGINCGKAAGQSVMHFHCHVIPRYRGDMKNPKGGVRYCIPDKGLY